MNAGDRIIYTKGQSTYRRELRGTYVEKRKGDWCRVLVDGMPYPTDTKDNRVRLDTDIQKVSGSDPDGYCIVHDCRYELVCEKCASDVS